MTTDTPSTKYWIFPIGTGEQRPPREWWREYEGWPDHHRNDTWFSGKPKVKAGDRAVLHGTRGTGFLAAVEVVSDPEPNDNEDGRERWAWKVGYRIVFAKLADENVISTGAIDGIKGNIRGHRTIRPDQYSSVVRLLEATGPSVHVG